MITFRCIQWGENLVWPLLTWCGGSHCGFSRQVALVPLARVESYDPLQIISSTHSSRFRSWSVNIWTTIGIITKHLYKRRSITELHLFHRREIYATLKPIYTPLLTGFTQSSLWTRRSQRNYTNWNIFLRHAMDNTGWFYSFWGYRLGRVSWTPWRLLFRADDSKLKFSGKCHIF